jgi:hypothetical protein
MTRPNDTVLEILRAVTDEYQRLQKSGGPPTPTFTVFAAVLAERTRNAIELANDIYYGRRTAADESTDLIGELRGELISIAAIAVEFVELIDLVTAGYLASRAIAASRTDPPE